MRVDKTKWEKSTLREVCEFRRGLTYPKAVECQEKSSNIVLRSNNIDLNTHAIVLDELKYLSNTFVIPENKKLIKDSILMCMSNGSAAHIGKVAFIDKDIDFAFGGFMGLIIPQSIIPKFLYYKYRSESFKSFLKKIGNGINITNLKFSSISLLKIVLPPLHEQQGIATELDSIQTMIDGYKAQIADLEELAKSIFLDLFGDPIENEKGWKITTLSSYGKIIGGTTPRTDNQLNWNNGIYNWVTPAELKGDRYYGSTLKKITDNALKHSNLTLMPIGTVLLSSRAPIGKVAITKEPMYCNQGFKNIVCKQGLNNEYLYQYLIFNNKELNRRGNGVTFKEISKKNVEIFPLILPPLSLQQQFATRVEEIEKQKELYKSQLKDAEQLMAERMQYYFS